MKSVGTLLMVVVLAARAAATDVPEAAVTSAIDKSLERIEAGVKNYPKHRQCFSCHHQAMAILSMTAAQQRGFKVDAELLAKQVTFSLKSFRNKSLIATGKGVGGDSVAIVYALHALAAAKHAPDDTTAAMVNYLLVKQRKDGAWPIPAFGDRRPTMGSLFTNTGLAMLALKKYSPPSTAKDAAELQPKIDAALTKGRDWLLANTPVETEDRVFHLRGLVDAKVEARHIDKARADLLKEQRPDGSWRQLPKLKGDAYATATALAALRHAGLDAKDKAYQKGVRYLLDSQEKEGAWIVQTRSKPLQVFFDNGDAGGKSQFISFAATNWAVLALLEVAPSRVPGAKADGDEG